MVSKLIRQRLLWDLPHKGAVRLIENNEHKIFDAVPVGNMLGFFNLFEFVLLSIETKKFITNFRFFVSPVERAQ